MTSMQQSGALRWRDVEIGGGRPDARLAIVAKGDRGGFSGLVRFPPGFERHEVGYYESAEWFVVLDGVLRLSDADYRAGDGAWIPERATRDQMTSLGGALVWARFARFPKWLTGDGEATPPVPFAAHAEPSRTPLGNEGVLVHEPDGASLWSISRLHGRVPNDCRVQVVDRTGSSYVVLDRGQVVEPPVDVDAWMAVEAMDVSACAIGGPRNV